jgi:ribokinase
MHKVLLEDARRIGLVTGVHMTGLPPELRTPSGFAELRRRFELVFLNRDLARNLTGYQGALPDLVRRTRDLVQATEGSSSESLVLLTLDEAGAMLFDHTAEPLHVPAPMVEPVDTTGAGDAFVGVFLATWLSGVAAPEATRLAVMAASRAIMIPGAQELRLGAAELLGLGKPGPADDRGGVASTPLVVSQPVGTAS